MQHGWNASGSGCGTPSSMSSTGARRAGSHVLLQVGRAQCRLPPPFLALQICLEIVQTKFYAAQLDEADRYSSIKDAANKFFGKDGILTKLPGQAEHPLSVSYGGTDNLLKVDSLVKGDLNQLKKVVFDTPIKNLTVECPFTGISVSWMSFSVACLLNFAKNWLTFKSTITLCTKLN